MYRRILERRVTAALGDTPAVFVEGPRQAGKSTLVRDLLNDPARDYLTLDDPTIASAAAADPAGFVSGLPERVTLDEVQRVPELFRSIKAEIDRRRLPGRFVLTGSAHALVVPKLSESLVGRIEILSLLPLAQSEIEGHRVDTLGKWFGDAPPTTPRSSAADWPQRAALGGFPEAVARRASARRRAWFDAYLRTLLAHDVLELSRIDGLHDLPRLLRLLAVRSGGLVNYSELSRTLGLPQTTLKRYVGLLEAVFAVFSLSSWSANLGKRLVRSSKLYASDSGVLTQLLGGEHLAARDHRGSLFEAFVLGELRRLSVDVPEIVGLHHFRTHDGIEVDFLLEHADGRLVAVEAKAAATVRERDMGGLRRFAELTGKRMHRGVVLYGGDAVVPLGPRMHAVPVSCLW
jgi:uncharacterized protein